MEEEIFDMDEMTESRREETTEYHVSDVQHRHKCDYLNNDSNPRGRFRSHTSHDYGMESLPGISQGDKKTEGMMPKSEPQRIEDNKQTMVDPSLDTLSPLSVEDHDGLVSRAQMSQQLYVTSDVPSDCLTQMKDLPDGFKPLFDILHKELDNLKLLSLSHLDLEKLPDNVEFPPNLEILYLTGNSLTTLPTGTILRLQKLKVLHLGSNNYKVIPFRAVSLLQNLESFDMTNNILENPDTSRIREISLTNMERLTTICLASNCLGSIPTEILSAKSLKQLDMSYNKIGSIPPEIGGLKELRYLNLKSNRLRRLPKELCQLKHLEVACFSENTISDPNVGELLCMPDSKIKMLCLHSNRIPANKVHDMMRDASKLGIDIRLAENCTEDSREPVKKYLRKCLTMDERVAHKWDVLVLHDDKDENIIENEIRPKLEDEMDFRVCLPYRDETLGKSRVAERSNLINFSKTIMLVITENLDTSKILGLDDVLISNGRDEEEECASLPDEQHHDTPTAKSRSKSLIPVVWSKGVQVPKELKGKVLVRRDSDVQEKYFWSKIRKAIQSHC